MKKILSFIMAISLFSSFGCSNVKLIPDGAKEGSVICIILDEESTGNREKTIKKRMNDLFCD